MPIPTPIPRRIPATGRTETRSVTKAGKPALAVYNASGVLIGTVDPSYVQALAEPDDGGKAAEKAKVAANAAKVKANTVAGQQEAAAAAEVAKSVGPVLATMKPRPFGEVKKAATTLSEQWTSLVKAAGPSTGAALQASVSHAALALMIAGKADGAKAVTLAKRATLQAAIRRNVL